MFLAVLLFLWKGREAFLECRAMKGYRVRVEAPDNRHWTQVISLDREARAVYVMAKFGSIPNVSSTTVTARDTQRPLASSTFTLEC